MFFVVVVCWVVWFLWCSACCLSGFRRLFSEKTHVAMCPENAFKPKQMCIYLFMVYEIKLLTNYAQMSFICHIHNYTEYNEEWNVFSAFNPSKSTHTWSSGQPTLRHPGSSWGFGALLKGLTSVVDTSCQSWDSNPQPRVSSPTLYPLVSYLRHYLHQFQTCHEHEVQSFQYTSFYVIIQKT